MQVCFWWKNKAKAEGEEIPLFFMENPVYYTATNKIGIIYSLHNQNDQTKPV